MNDEINRIGELERALAQATAELDRLSSREAIRDCVLRFNRGLDRIDRDLMASAFCDDATVDYGAIYRGGIASFLDATVINQARQSEAQHLIGNILIEIDGDQASCESYELARHKSPREGEMVDLILAMRTLDRFERRANDWRIVHRHKVVDWGRTLPGSDSVYEHSPLDKGARNLHDPSYLLREIFFEPRGLAFTI